MNGNSSPLPCSRETPTLEQTLAKVIEYTEWWKEQPQPFRGVALGQLNHTKRRLQMILKWNDCGKGPCDDGMKALCPVKGASFRSSPPPCAVNPDAWKHCIAWSQVPGCNYACFDMCSPDQREACKTNGNAELRGTPNAEAETSERSE
jgi:hypothetical protein